MRKPVVRASENNSIKHIIVKVLSLTHQVGQIINFASYLNFKKTALYVFDTLYIPKNEPVPEKTNILGYDQVRHKPGCTVTEDG